MNQFILTPVTQKGQYQVYRVFTQTDTSNYSYYLKNFKLFKMQLIHINMVLGKFPPVHFPPIKLPPDNLPNPNLTLDRGGGGDCLNNLQTSVCLFARINTSSLINIEKILNRPITKF